MRFPIAFLLAGAAAVQAQINFPPDVFISRLEVVQTVQDEDQTVPLTAGKATAVRAFIKQEGRPESLIANITVLLHGFRNGEELPTSPIRAVNPGVTARPSPDRSINEHAQNFVLPLSWTTAGTLELRTELRLPAGTVETPADNNDVTRQVEFFPPIAANPVIAWLPMCIGSNCVTGAAAYQRFTERVFPFADGTVRYEDVPVPAVAWERAPSDEASGASLAAHLKKWLLLLGESPLKPHVLAAWLPRGSQAIAPAGGSGDAFWIVEQAEDAVNQQLLARQLAAGYRVVADDPCGAYVLEPGFDPLHGFVLAPSRLEFPALCGSSNEGYWVSPGLAHYLANRLDAFRPAAAQTGSDRLLISGSAGADGTAAFSGFLRLSSRVRTTLTAEETGAVVRIASTAGTLDHNVVLPAAGPFTISVPVDGVVSSVTLRREGVEVASATAGSTSPEVVLNSPGAGETWTGTNTLRWTASDPLARPLTYTVFYSSGGGTNWTPLAVDLRTPQLAVNSTFLAGAEVSFRVIANAGLDQAQVISDTVKLANRPEMRLPGTTLDFGSVSAGQFAERPLGIRNGGTGRLEVGGLTADKAVFRVLAEPPFAVRAGTERPLPVRFSPRTAGPDSGELTLSSDAGASTTAIALRGTVFDRPVPNGSVTPSALSFGEVPVGISRELSATVTNGGTAPLSVSSVSVVNARFTVSPATAFALSPGASRQFTVRFSPNAGGEQTGAVSFATNDPATPSLRLDVRGTGVVVPQPSIDVNRSSLNFENVNLNQFRSLALDVRNGGNAPLILSALTSSNPVFTVTSPSLPATVAPGAIQVVSLRFTPVGVGTQNGTLAIQSNDPLRPTVTVEMAGTGLAAIPAPKPQISSVHPAALTAGSPGFTLTVSGSNFTSSSQGEWNGTALPTRFLSANVLKVTVPAQTIASAHTAPVTVSNPAPGGRSNSVSVFVDPPGPSARIVNFNLTGCPSLIDTVTVTDRLFSPITALGGSNLQCSEDGVPFPCSINSALALGSRLSVLIVLHASASITDPAAQRLDIGSMQRYAKTFINAVDIQDRVAITQMDNGVRLRADFRDADNRTSLHDQVDQLLPVQGMGTALYDAVEDGVQRLLRENRRRALLVFTGSENTYDSNGPRNLDDFSAFLQSSGVPVYFVPLGDGLKKADLLAVLNQMALDSGGALFSEQGIDFGSLMGRLSTTLHSQQFLNYNTPHQDGQPHQLKVIFSVPGATFTTARSYNGCR